MVPALIVLRFTKHFILVGSGGGIPPGISFVVLPDYGPALGALEVTLVTDEGQLWVRPEPESLVAMGAVHRGVGGEHGEQDSLSAGTASPSNINNPYQPSTLI